MKYTIITLSVITCILLITTIISLDRISRLEQKIIVIQTTARSAYYMNRYAGMPTALDSYEQEVEQLRMKVEICTELTKNTALIFFKNGASERDYRRMQKYMEKKYQEAD